MESYLLGLFAGDGWFENRGIRFGTKNFEFAEKIKESLEKTYRKRVVLKLRKYKDGHSLYIVGLHNKQIRELFGQKLGTTKNKSKTFIIPNFDKIEDARAFIAGIFDAEGHSRIWRNQPRVAMEIFNENAARTIHSFLRNDSIKASLSVCSDGGYRIDITSKRNVERLYADYPFLRLTFPTGKSQL